MRAKKLIYDWTTAPQRFFFLSAFTQQTATISHDALFGSLVSRPPTLQAPSQVQASESWSMAALPCLQSRMHHRQQCCLQDPLTHTFLWAWWWWWWGDLTSGPQQALSTSPPPPSLPTTGYPPPFFFFFFLLNQVFTYTTSFFLTPEGEHEDLFNQFH